MSNSSPQIVSLQKKSAKPNSSGPPIDEQNQAVQSRSPHPSSDNSSERLTSPSESQNSQKLSQDSQKASKKNKQPTFSQQISDLDSKIWFKFLYNYNPRSKVQVSDYEDRIKSRDFLLSCGWLNATILASLTSSFGLIVAPILIPSLWFFFKEAMKFSKSAKDIQREEKAQRHIAQLLKEHFIHQKGTIYSLLDDNRIYLETIHDYLDIFLKLPSGQQIAFKVIDFANPHNKVFYDEPHERLRYRHRRGKQDWFLEPTDFLKLQISCLREQKKKLPQSLQMVVVFTSPTQVKVWDDKAIQVEQLKILKVNDVYVVEEQALVSLVKYLSRQG